MASNVKDEKGSGAKRIGGKIGRSFRDMRGEMKKVVWPSKKQVLNNTGIVLAFMLVAAVVVGGFDLILSAIVKLSLGA